MHNMTNSIYLNFLTLLLSYNPLNKLLILYPSSDNRQYILNQVTNKNNIHI
jgi:hypothetical protein